MISCKIWLKSSLKCRLNKVVYSLFNAVNNEIIHRDIKPSNIMLDHANQVKLIDYGCARVDISQIEEYKDWFDHIKQRFSLEVGTRWYKAPEMLLGSKQYDKSVDVWAIGWVFAELMKMKPLFKGMNDIEQIVTVVKLIGTPTDETWPEFKELPDYPKLIFPNNSNSKVF